MIFSELPLLLLHKCAFACLCVCVCCCTCYILNTKICILLAKVGLFWAARTSWLLRMTLKNWLRLGFPLQSESGSDQRSG